MREIAATPKNGLRVVSTFSGAGGSCLGFRMAGFEILWASEFIEEARKTYRANSPSVPLDDRDIRKVTAASILKATKLKVGQLDVLEGSPPCASFSTAGKRQKHWGKKKSYSDKVQRTDDLFFEFVRLLRGLKPKVFVAENVSGLAKGAAKGYFLDIQDAMRRAGYVVSAKMLDAQWLGVPQCRQRVIFVGVRKDLKRQPLFPKPLPYRYGVAEAIADLADVAAVRTKKGRRSAAEPAPTVQTHGRRRTHSELTLTANLKREWDKLGPGDTSSRFFNLSRPREGAPCPTVTAIGGSSPGTASVTHPTEPRKFTMAELRRVCAFPDDFVLTGKYAQQWERLGRAVPPLMMRAIAEKVREILT